MSAENEPVSTANFDKCSVVLLDVAGTTTAIGFVRDTLFPFATSNVESFLKSNWDDVGISDSIKLLKTDDKELDIDGATETFKKLTEENSDNKGVKKLQGEIYKKGYEDGTLKAHVFSDVAKALEKWSEGRCIAIYSTGSEDSQKLLFAYTTEGNLTKHISNYFDLSVGVKTDPASYTKIATTLSVKPEEITFISDNVDEAKAAKEAGVRSVLIEREGNAEIPKDAAQEFLVISSFADLPLEASGKRKNTDEDDAIEAPPTKVAKTEEPETNEAVATEEGVKPKPTQNSEPVEAMEVDSTEASDDAPKKEEIPAVNGAVKEPPTKEAKTAKESSTSESKPKEDSLAKPEPSKPTEKSDEPKPIIEDKEEAMVVDSTAEIATEAKEENGVEVAEEATEKIKKVEETPAQNGGAGDSKEGTEKIKKTEETPALNDGAGDSKATTETLEKPVVEEKIAEKVVTPEVKIDVDTTTAMESEDSSSVEVKGETKEPAKPAAKDATPTKVTEGKVEIPKEAKVETKEPQAEASVKEPLLAEDKAKDSQGDVKVAQADTKGAKNLPIEPKAKDVQLETKEAEIEPKVKESQVEVKTKEPPAECSTKEAKEEKPRTKVIEIVDTVTKETQIEDKTKEAKVDSSDTKVEPNAKKDGEVKVVPSKSEGQKVENGVTEDEKTSSIVVEEKVEESTTSPAAVVENGVVATNGKGVEDSATNGDVANGTVTESKEETSEEKDIKVKKLDKGESTAVSVEV